MALPEPLKERSRRSRVVNDILTDLSASPSSVDAHKVDGLHAAASGADAHVLATDASGNATVSAKLTIGGQQVQVTNVIRAVFTKALVDNTATTVFTITTTNETGDNDAGGYACFLDMLVFNGLAPAQVATVSKSWTGHFCRAVGGAGTGVTSAVSEVSESASAAIDWTIRDIGTVTVSTAENGEYEVNVQVLADHTGTGPAQLYAAVSVKLVWYGFTTAPVLS